MSALSAATVSPPKPSYVQTLDEAWQAHLAPRAADAPTVVSLFAGCGGSSLGYSMAGYRELLAVEWNQNAVDTFRLNFPDVPVYHGDIHDLSTGQALELAGVQPGELDVLDGSPPCQGFSTAGKRIMADSRNQLFQEYVRLLDGFKPRAFVMENVSGMVKGKMKLIFAEILRALKACGYQVRAWLLNAMWYGVPQRRQRTIFIGVRIGLGGAPGYPQPGNSQISCRSAIGDLEGCAPQEDATHRSHIREQWKTGYNPRNGRAGLRVVRPGAYVGSFNSCRLEPSKPAATFVKSHNHWHYSEFRRLTSREAGRLSSFPDSYQWQSDFIERIGNSVPPLFMRAIAEHVRRTIIEPSRG